VAAQPVRLFPLAEPVGRLMEFEQASVLSAIAGAPTAIRGRVGRDAEQPRRQGKAPIIIATNAVQRSLEGVRRQVFGFFSRGAVQATEGIDARKIVITDLAEGSPVVSCPRDDVR